MSPYPEVATIDEMRNIVQERWNITGKLIKSNNLPDDLVEYFFSFYTDEKNDPLDIDKKGYLKLVDS